MIGLSGSYTDEDFAEVSSLLPDLMGLSAYLVPDVPAAVPIQLKRQEVLVTKVMRGVPDPEKKIYPAHTKDLYVHNEEDRTAPNLDV